MSEVTSCCIVEAQTEKALFKFREASAVSSVS